MPLPLDVSSYFSGADLTFSATGLPAGLSIDPVTGVISGTPTLAQTTTVTVTALNPAGQASDSFTWTITGTGSGQSGTGSGLPPSSAVAPSIAGTALIGQSLTASPGVWEGSPAPAVSLQWRRNGAAIAGETGSVYTLTPADDLTAITVSVTAANTADTVTVSAGPVSPVYPAPVAGGALSDLTLELGSGPVTVDAAAGFSNATGGTWSVTGTGVSVDQAGQVTVQTTAERSADPVVVAYGNSGGSASAGFLVTVADSLPSALTLSETVTQDGLSFPPDGPGGAGLASIPLAGTAAPGAVIEVPDYRTKAPAVWTTLATADGAGNWAGTVQAVAQPGGYFRPQVRLAANTGVTAQMAARVGVGPVILIEGQSIEAHIVATAHDALSPAIDPVAERVLLLTEGGTTEILGPANRHTSAAARMANTLIALGDADYTYTLVFATQSGTSKTQLVDDGNATRGWAGLQGMLDTVYGSGSHVSVYQEKHFNADAGYAASMIPIWTGLQADGTPVSALGVGIDSAGLEVAAGTGVYDLDHCMFDLAAAPGTFGKGVLRADQTRFAYHFQCDPADKDMLGQMVNAGGTEEANMRKYQRLWESLRAAIASGPLAGLDAEAVHASLFQYGTGGSFEEDATHPADNALTGLSQHAMQLAAYALDRLGEIALPAPAEIASVTWAPDGSSAVVAMTADVTTNEDTPGAVAGFEIARAGQDHGTESTDWRFADALGTVVLGPGANEITITPAVLFADGDAIRFGYGGATGQSVYPGQSQAEFWKRYPVTATALLSTGVPAMPQGSGSFAASGIGAAPAVHAYDGAYDLTAIEDNATSGLTDRLFLQVVASVDTATGIEQALTIMTGNEMFFGIAANGNLRLNVPGIADTDIETGGLRGPLVDFRLSVDLRAGGLVRSWADIGVTGTLALQHDLATGAAQSFSGVRKPAFFTKQGGSNPGPGQIRAVKIWYQAHSDDGTLPAAAPSFSLEAGTDPLATFNDPSVKGYTAAGAVT